MIREMSPPASRGALFALALVFALAAAVLGGGAIGKPASAAQGDGSFVLCKQYWATGPSINNFDGEFAFLVEFEVGEGDSAAPVEVSLDAFEGGENCSDPIVIPAGASVTVTEALPAGWVNTPTYPRSVLRVGDSDDPLRIDSTIATFDGGRCIDDGCVLTFKNKQDETGEGIVPPLVDPFRGSLRVCKAFLDNGDDFQVGPTQFTFEWNDKFGGFEFPIGPFIPEGVTGCSGFSVLDVYPGDTVTLRELPTENFAMAPGFPKVELEGPNGFEARSGASVTVDLTTCSEAGGFTANLIDGEPTFDCQVTFSNRAVAIGEEVPCDDCSEPEPTPDPAPVAEEPTAAPVQPELPVFIETPVVVEPQPTVEPSPEPTAPIAETPAAPAPSEPTSSPEPVDPTPAETVAGEVTAGPQPTPLAPSTGSGVTETNGGRLAISIGLAVLSLAFFIGGLGLSRRE